MKAAALLLPLALAACTSPEPFERPGTWSVERTTGGANDANLRTMIVDPQDLKAGTGEANSAGPAAAQPVRRLLTGQRPALPQSGAAALKSTGGNSGPAPAPAGQSAP